MKTLFLFFLIFLLYSTLLIVSYYNPISFFIEGYDRPELIPVRSDDDIRYQLKNNSNYFSELILNRSQFEIIANQTISLTLDDSKPISTIDVAWKNSSNTRYNFTLTILSDNKTIGKEFNYLSDILPDKMSQTAGTKNTIGKAVFLTLNSPKNIKIDEAIDGITIHLVNEESPIKFNNKEQLNNLKIYPENITIGNSNGSVFAGLYRITDGDELDMTNPNFTFSRSLNTLGENSFYVVLPFNHIEGISARTDSAKFPVIISTLNDTIDENDIVKGKKVYFNIYATSIDKIANNFENLTLQLAPSSETSVYYMAKLNIN